MNVDDKWPSVRGVQWRNLSERTSLPNKKKSYIYLVVEPPHLKNMLVKMGSSSHNRGEHEKYLKPPPR